MTARWTLVAYRTPTEPSTARVSAWRALHRLGGLYLGPTVCLLPTALADRAQLARIQTRVNAAGGTFDVFEIELFAPDAEARLRSRCDEARAAEYAEIVERSEAIVHELEREGARDKFTFAEVEENEAGLTKLRQWLRRVTVRDVFGCPARAAANAAVRRAEDRLAAFVEQAIAREAGASVAEAFAPSERRLRVVHGEK
jgi:hypothetical protein